MLVNMFVKAFPPDPEATRQKNTPQVLYLKDILFSLHWFLQ